MSATPGAAALLTRRGFLEALVLAGAGLVIGVRLGAPGEAGTAAAAFEPNVWLRVDPSGQVTIWCIRSEMGQGVLTSMPMLVAEELEVDLDRVRVEQADADAKYGDMSTGGSSSVRGSWEPLRRAGAAAREPRPRSSGAWRRARAAPSAVRSSTTPTAAASPTARWSPRRRSWCRRSRRSRTRATSASSAGGCSPRPAGEWRKLPIAAQGLRAG